MLLNSYGFFLESVRSLIYDLCLTPVSCTSYCCYHEFKYWIFSPFLFVVWHLLICAQNRCFLLSPINIFCPPFLVVLVRVHRPPNVTPRFGVEESTTQAFDLFAFHLILSFSGRSKLLSFQSLKTSTVRLS